ncbi:hypothetical protein, partial [Streptococcus pneumoniae]
MPGHGDVEVHVASVKLDNGPKYYDVYTAGYGGGPRVVIWDADNSVAVKDMFVYEESFRGGISDIATIGNT